MTDDNIIYTLSELVDDLQERMGASEDEVRQKFYELLEIVFDGKEVELKGHRD